MAARAEIETVMTKHRTKTLLLMAALLAAPLPGAPQKNPDSGYVPPYHDARKGLPALAKTLDPEYFSQPLVRSAYRIAKQKPRLLAQLPCYCYCYRIGHGSLLDCYASDHGAACLICIKEAFLADQMSRKGETVATIRKAIIQGEWKTVDLRFRR